MWNILFNLLHKNFFGLLFFYLSKDSFWTYMEVSLLLSSRFIWMKESQAHLNGHFLVPWVQLHPLCHTRPIPLLEKLIVSESHSNSHMEFQLWWYTCISNFQLSVIYPQHVVPCYVYSYLNLNVNQVCKSNVWMK